MLKAKALYYPHTEIGSEAILKNALLLWDEIETIVPGREWKSSSRMEKTVQEAVQLVVKRRVPSSDERYAAHKALATMVQSGFVANLIANSPAQWRAKKYLIYPEKFPKETWKLLERGGMAQWVQHEDDYGVPAAVGFLMMSLLADQCAGTQIRKVTDRTDAYNWLSEMHAKALGSQIVSGKPDHKALSHDRLVSMSFEALDGRRIPLEKLVQMRKREAKSGGADYSALRRRYLAALDSHIARVSKEAKSESDLKELNRQFQEDIKQDVSDLRTELGIAAKKTLLSKELVMSVLILAGSVVSPFLGLSALATEVGGVAGVIPLMKAAVDYRGKRRDILRKHMMSWLYVSKRKAISLF
jgi:hypothetical protein